MFDFMYSTMDQMSDFFSLAFSNFWYMFKPILFFLCIFLLFYILIKFSILLLKYIIAKKWTLKFLIFGHDDSLHDVESSNNSDNFESSISHYVVKSYRRVGGSNHE